MQPQLRFGKYAIGIGTYLTINFVLLSRIDCEIAQSPLKVRESEWGCGASAHPAAHMDGVTVKLLEDKQPMCAAIKVNIYQLWSSLCYSIPITVFYLLIYLSLTDTGRLFFIWLKTKELLMPKIHHDNQLPTSYSPVWMQTVYSMGSSSGINLPLNSDGCYNIFWKTCTKLCVVLLNEGNINIWCFLKTMLLKIRIKTSFLLWIQI